MKLALDAADFVLGLAAILFLAVFLAGCGAEPCQPSTTCEGQTFVRCVDDVPELVDCAAEGRACLLDVSDLANPTPTCGTLGVPPEAP